MGYENSGSVEQKSNGEGLSQAKRAFSLLSLHWLGSKPRAVLEDLRADSRDVFAGRRRVLADDVYGGTHRGNREKRFSRVSSVAAASPVVNREVATGTQCPSVAVNGVPATRLFCAAIRAVVALATIMLLAVSQLAMPNLALATSQANQVSDQVANQADQQSSTENLPAQTILQTITYDALKGMPEPDQSITTADGNEYELLHIGDAYPLPGAIHERTYSVRVEKAIDVEIVDAGQDALRNAFDQSFAINDAGFTGSIALASIDIAPVYASIEESVERQLVFTGRPSADISDLPLSYRFIVASDEYIGATCEKELQRLGVTTAIESYAADGRPDSYTATVTFRGLQSRLIVAWYQAEAHYEGVVRASQIMMCVDVSYQLIEAPVTQQEAVATQTVSPIPVPTTISTVSEQPASNSFWLRGEVLITAAIILVLLILIPLLYYRLRFDARLMRIGENGSELLVYARRLEIRRDASDQPLAILRISDEAMRNCLKSDCCLVLSGKRYLTAGAIEVRYQTKLIYKAKPAERIYLSRALLSAAATAITTEDDLSTEQSAA